MTWCPPKAKVHRPRGFGPWRPQGDTEAFNQALELERDAKQRLVAWWNSLPEFSA